MNQGFSIRQKLNIPENLRAVEPHQLRRYSSADEKRTIVLDYIRQHAGEAMKYKDISKGTGLSIGTAHGHLQLLIAEGLVSRRNGVWFYHPTPVTPTKPTIGRPRKTRRPTGDIIFDYLRTQTGGKRVAEIAEATGLDTTRVGAALWNGCHPTGSSRPIFERMSKKRDSKYRLADFVRNPLKQGEKTNTQIVAEFLYRYPWSTSTDIIRGIDGSITDAGGILQQRDVFPVKSNPGSLNTYNITEEQRKAIDELLNDSSPRSGQESLVLDSIEDYVRENPGATIPEIATAIDKEEQNVRVAIHAHINTKFPRLRKERDQDGTLRVHPLYLFRSAAVEEPETIDHTAKASEAVKQPDTQPTAQLNAIQTLEASMFAFLRTSDDPAAHVVGLTAYASYLHDKVESGKLNVTTKEDALERTNASESERADESAIS